jgi:hypothetical protein
MQIASRLVHTLTSARMNGVNNVPDLIHEVCLTDARVSAEQEGALSLQNHCSGHSCYAFPSQLFTHAVPALYLGSAQVDLHCLADIIGVRHDSFRWAHDCPSDIVTGSTCEQEQHRRDDTSHSRNLTSEHQIDCKTGGLATYRAGAVQWMQVAPHLSTHLV